MTLSADEFIRRFLIHVLPQGFHRIRHFGLFANTGRAANLAKVRVLLEAAVRPADFPGRQRQRRHLGSFPLSLLWRPACVSSRCSSAAPSPASHRPSPREGSIAHEPRCSAAHHKAVLDLQPQSWPSRRLPCPRFLAPAMTTTTRSRTRPTHPSAMVLRRSASRALPSPPASRMGASPRTNPHSVRPPSRGSDLRHSQTPASVAPPTSALGGRPRMLNPCCSSNSLDSGSLRPNSAACPFRLSFCRSAAEATQESCQQLRSRTFGSDNQEALRAHV